MRVICLRSELLQRTSGDGAMALLDLSIDEATERGRPVRRPGRRRRQQRSALDRRVRRSRRCRRGAGRLRARRRVRPCRQGRRGVAQRPDGPAGPRAGRRPGRPHAAADDDPAVLDGRRRSRGRARRGTPTTGAATCASRSCSARPSSRCSPTASTPSSRSVRIRRCCPASPRSAAGGRAAADDRFVAPRRAGARRPARRPRCAVVRRSPGRLDATVPRRFVPSGCASRTTRGSVSATGRRPPKPSPGRVGRGDRSSTTRCERGCTSRAGIAWSTPTPTGVAGRWSVVGGEPADAHAVGAALEAFGCTVDRRSVRRRPLRIASALATAMPAAARSILFLPGRHARRSTRSPHCRRCSAAGRRRRRRRRHGCGGSPAGRRSCPATSPSSRPTRSPRRRRSGVPLA